MTTYRYTSHDLESLPQHDGNRYEIIDGELYVSTAPQLNHQAVCFNCTLLLQLWSDQVQPGSMAYWGSGLIFADDDDVIPDVIWISKDRLDRAEGPDGHLHAPPELAIEILSPGRKNKWRDREKKLNLYSRRGVLEYWIVNWPTRSIEVYRREGDILKFIETLHEGDMLQSPRLPGFQCQIKEVFLRLR